jgi:hypothetical protein
MPALYPGDLVMSLLGLSAGRTHAAGDRITILCASSANGIYGTVFDGPDVGAKVCDGHGRASDGQEPRQSLSGDSAGLYAAGMALLGLRGRARGKAHRSGLTAG